MVPLAVNLPRMLLAVAFSLTALPNFVKGSGCPQTWPNSTYDYIVVGSGPGGGPLAANLAKHGYSTLLVEAGDDQSNNLNSEIPQLFPFAYIDETLRWDFFVRNYADEARTRKHNKLTWRKPDGTFYVGLDPPANSTMLGVYYPRGGTLGGSSAVNAMGSVLPSDSDWQNLVNLTGDASWSPESMRKIFQRIEQNHYLPRGTAGHGFGGYFETNMGDSAGYKSVPEVLTVMKSIAKSLGQDPDKILDLLNGDVNPLNATRDQTQGVFGSVLHVTAAWHRFSSRDYVLAVANATFTNGTKKYPLYLSLQTLATKITWDTTIKHSRQAITKQPRAIGIEYLRGKSVYGADPRHNASKVGVTGRFTASREVIIAGGAINSPQLLKLSGVGPAAELASFQIPVVVDLPGVGSNLQDNQEVPIVAHATSNFTAQPDPSTPACTYGAPGDPCVDLWRQGKGPYMSFGNLNACFRKSQNAALGERDQFFTAGTYAIRGFWPPTDQLFLDPPNTFALSTVKMHPGLGQNSTAKKPTYGYVRLRSADPRDVPDVNFNLFDGGNANDSDVLAIADTVRWARRTFATVSGPVGPITNIEPPCPAGPSTNGVCDDAVDKEWIMNQAFGHHPTGTCAIGSDGDKMAVLDGRFRVRGVLGLRVVDASAHPRSPGAFPVLPTFMLSEKATDFILEDAGKK